MYLATVPLIVRNRTGFWFSTAQIPSATTCPLATTDQERRDHLYFWHASQSRSLVSDQYSLWRDSPLPLRPVGLSSPNDKTFPAGIGPPFAGLTESSPVDPIVGARDELAFIAQQEHNQRGDFFGRAVSRYGRGKSVFVSGVGQDFPHLMHHGRSDSATVPQARINGASVRSSGCNGKRRAGFGQG